MVVGIPIGGFGMKTAIIVHGGAGAWQIGSKRLAEAVAACLAAAQRGTAILQGGGSALDAVEAAVRLLEDCPVLDAGTGSYRNTKGEIEMDALIMDGQTLNLGAVAAIQRVRYPVSLARQVMDRTHHTFLVGEGASEFADEIGFPRCQAEELMIPEEDELPVYMTLGDTVGAVAIDSAGNLACATSTGGTKGKMPGRVGDSPLVGSGGYADNDTAGVSATGHGESLMKVVISKQVCDFVGQGMNTQDACEEAIQLMAQRVNGYGGVIAIDRYGWVGYAYNTSAMPYTYIIGKDEAISGY